MEDWIENINVPEVPVVVEFDTASLLKLSLVLFVTAVAIFWAYKQIR